ncbi:hypothetical protein AALP_AA8G037400 [Arabis alpina]|uniref:Flowering-promoting factor 1-like protein 3 n=1 Tax=Arabis alpina TaxID=50452 RepID=A0A087G4T4_ARAAL|nr:hypothetical protein AALP_AA8G037400 [Arabis alpina]
MAGQWVFNNGVVRLVENTGAEMSIDKTKRKDVLVYTSSDEVITSYSLLEQHLNELGWERYEEDPSLLQFHKRSSLDLITLPKDFSWFHSVHMHDIATKNPDMFEVRDA